MRRGHSGGWRNENPRHFRPRIGGNTHFRPPRSYGAFEAPRFRPPFDGPRPLMAFNRPDISDQPPDHLDRYRYRNNQTSYQRPHQQGERRVLPSLLQWNKKGESHRNTSKESSRYYVDQSSNQYPVNSMGDVDHRQMPQLREGYPRIPSISPWMSDHPLHQHSGNRHSSYRQDRGQPNNPSAASVEYTGHRPPASDHYGCNPTSVIDSSNSFSRSVDDTVDLVRKRLQNRNDPQQTDHCQDNTSAVDQTLVASDNSQSQKQPMRKRYQRPKNVTNKSNCAKIKDKIVHQLFKMDKEKIHKLMDNPNSSSKFEYAISSLITESQNSFNRHLRSAAEKSLCESSTEFIENDNNTIYEDTFMKQMQCMLDPQDTVFLEDIKPFVMAEITKVLQLNEYEQNYNTGDEALTTDKHGGHENYSMELSNNNYTQESFPSEDYYSGIKDSSQTDYQRSRSVEPPFDNNYQAYDEDPSYYEDSKLLFQRRQRTKSFSYADSNPMSDITYYGRETEEICNENLPRPRTPQDLFDANAELLSEDDDPFAELDNQYHVAVDHDFIEQDDLSNPGLEKEKYSSSSTESFKEEPLAPEKNLKNIGKDIEAQLHDMAKSALKLSLPAIKQETKDTLVQCKQEPMGSTNILPLQEKNENNVSLESENTSNKKEPESKEISKETDKNDPLSNLKSVSSNSRKRSTDQRPSHRKEKRKKSESCSSEPNKQILNKNIIINVNDCASKKSDKCENSKSIFNLFFSKDESKAVSQDNKTVSSNDKVHTEKHIKRKETITPKKTNDKESKRKDSTSSNAISSPRDSIGDTPIKAETKTTLKPIDMFNDQPKKTNTTHQAHRNTVPALSSTPKVEIVTKHKPTGPLCKQLVRKHVAVQVIRKVHAKHTQTPPSKCGLEACQPKKKLNTKSTQTDMKTLDKPGFKSSDAFERMKEIDLEIQVLLQEKFKLYSSMEAKDNGNSSMQTLGMTVLNVNPFQEDENNETTEDNVLSEDAIVNDFANIPVEELEQIALESVQDHEEQGTSNKSKRNCRRKVPYEVSHAQSPVTIQKRKLSKPKSPNISLIEQIIKDDRPLEDIISLDDLEIPQTKTKNKKKSKSSKKKASKSKVVKPTDVFNYTIKECSVIIKRIDITPYINTIRHKTPEPVIQLDDTAEDTSKTDINQKGINLDTSTNSEAVFGHNDNIIEETIVNELSTCQFDMLDVSEDIVVGDSCEVKSLQDKEEITENVIVPVCEEIILDNSQSSMEDAAAPVGQDGECKMYDYSADESLRRDSIIVSGNADAVLAVEWVENNFLAACLDGNVYYFNSEGQLLTTLRGSNLAVTCLTIVKEKYGTTVYTGSLDSRIRYYDLETGLEKGPECNVLSPIQTMDRAWDTVFVGTKTGFVLQFECKNNMLIPVSSVKFSDQAILALRAMKEGPRKVLLVAARSENVAIKDAQTGLLLRELVGPKMTVYSLLYEDGKIYCGTSTHQIHVFDYASGAHAGMHSGGKGAVCLRAAGGLLFAGCYDGCVYVYREGQGQPFAQLRGPGVMLLSLAVQGSKIIAGYKDRSLYIWKIPLCILQEMIL